MSFLQPFILWGLPLITLPIVIHLIHRQRHYSVPWGAMMFLLAAQRMNRGMARLRQILILAARVLAVTGLIVAISRPLASGWIGMTGSTAQTTIVLLDRSASMEQQNLQTGESKRSRALNQVLKHLAKFNHKPQLVLIENTDRKPRRLDASDELLELPLVNATATTSNVPAMLEAALDYVTENSAGRTDIWVCSDLRESDWRPESGRWQTIRAGFAELPAVRLHLLCYPDLPEDNLSVRVTNVQRRETADRAELVLDYQVERSLLATEPQEVDLQFVVNGVRSSTRVKLSDRQTIGQGYTIPLDRNITSGFGRLEIGADSNPQDNAYSFVFAEQLPHRCAIVAEDPAVAEVLQLAASTPLDATLEYEASIFTPNQVQRLDWETTTTILWQGKLPTGAIAKQLENFVASGRTVIFWPPRQVDDNELFSGQWQKWLRTKSDEASPVANWRSDDDLLQHARDGQSLPVGEWEVFSYCQYEATPGRALAVLEDGRPLLTRVDLDSGAVYFCGTLPLPADSNLAEQGLVYLAILHRAIAQGTAALSPARHFEAGRVTAELSQWKATDESSRQHLPSQRDKQTGSYRSQQGFIAVNRSVAEDQPEAIERATLESLCQGTRYTIVDDQVGRDVDLASEIWRIFVYLLLIALIAEAVLCLPERTAAGSYSQRSNS